MSSALPQTWKAIAAMSTNRVIGHNNDIPWRIPEDWKWFQRTTRGQVVVMGRKTFESIGEPLPKRTNVVVSRSLRPCAGITIINSLGELDRINLPGQIWICGGAEIYRQALPRCSDLLLTIVLREVTGDTYFPPYEDLFRSRRILREESEFRIEHLFNPG